MGDLNARTSKQNDYTDSVHLFDKYLHTVDSEIDEINICDRHSEDNIVNSSGIKLLDVCKSTYLRIANGRIGDDENIGQYTFMSNIGSSVIDYAVVSAFLFSIISNFIVHDLYTYSCHAPIQMNVHCAYESVKDDIPNATDKLAWDTDRVDLYKQSIATELNNLNNVVNDVLCSNISIDSGMVTFGDTLYNCANTVFGVHKYTNNQNNRGNCKNPWFNSDCDSARRDFNRANKLYRLNRSPNLLAIVIDKRRYYRRIKRISKRNYDLKKKSQLHNLSKLNPKAILERN